MQITRISAEYLNQDNHLTFCPIFVAVPKNSQNFPKVFLLESELDNFLENNSGFFGKICSVPYKSSLHLLLRATIDKNLNPEQFNNILGTEI